MEEFPLIHLEDITEEHPIELPEDYARTPL